ncbi:MAG: DNA polymerase III subunit beta [Clostridia bacterium]|nr:DNA polymerase III subunit beta [Clostridia bacterium]
MKFTADAAGLGNALNMVTRAIPARAAKPIMESVLVEAQDGQVVLTCTDGTFSIQSSIEARVEEDGRMALQGRFFADMIRKLPGGDVSVSTKGSELAQIRCGGVRTSMMGKDPMEFPEMAEVTDGQKVTLPQNLLRNMISRVSFAVAMDETRQILTGILMEIKNGEMRLVALDGFRLALQSAGVETTLPADGSLTRRICPGKVMSELSRILTDEESACEISFDEKHMAIRFGGTLLSTVLMSGQYIDYERIMPKSFATSIKLDRSQLSSAIDFASLYAREAKNNLVKMRIEDNMIGISSNAELGDFHQDLSIFQDGPGLQIAFNAKYVTDVLRAVSDDEICMRFNANIHPCIIGPVEGEGYQYLILPVRVFE